MSERRKTVSQSHVAGPHAVRHARSALAALALGASLGGVARAQTLIFTAPRAGVLPPAKVGVKATTTVGLAASSLKISVGTGLYLPPAIPAAPAVPTFRLELQDDDAPFGDNCDSLPRDITDTTGGVLIVGAGWALMNTRVNILTAQAASDYVYEWTLPAHSEAADITPCDDLGNNAPDPEVNFFAAIGAATLGGNMMVPLLPLPGMGDVGVSSPPHYMAGSQALPPQHLANSSKLLGFDIAAQSRGYDEIAALATSASFAGAPVAVPGLYFTTDRSTQDLPPGFATHSGSVFVLDAEGNTWLDSAFLVPTSARCDIRFLNIDTAPSGGTDGTGELYVVMTGTRAVRYSATGHVPTAGLYLDLTPFASQPVVALAVEDIAPRGSWSAGDAVLFAERHSAIVRKFSFGDAVPSTLVANGETFDGATALDFEHLGGDPTTFPIGEVTSLAVASYAGSQAVPSDRWYVDFVERGSTHGPRAYVHK